MRFLIIEDQKRLADTLVDILTENHDTADVSYDGISGYDNALSDIYDGIILDVMLPGMDGFTIAKNLRKEGIQTPILILSAKSDLADRINGLDFGADYYLTKPFERAELLACLRAIVRRRSEIQTEEYSFGNITLNLSSGEVSCADLSVRLSAKEMDILRILIEGKGNIISKERLLLKVWGYDSDAEANNVEAYISFLRKKLDYIRSDVVIRVVRGIGYRLEEKKND